MRRRRRLITPYNLGVCILWIDAWDVSRFAFSSGVTVSSMANKALTGDVGSASRNGVAGAGEVTWEAGGMRGPCLTSVDRDFLITNTTSQDYSATDMTAAVPHRRDSDTGGADERVMWVWGTAGNREFIIGMDNDEATADRYVANSSTDGTAGGLINSTVEPSTTPRVLMFASDNGTGGEFFIDKTSIGTNIRYIGTDTGTELTLFHNTATSAAQSAGEFVIWLNLLTEGQKHLYQHSCSRRFGTAA